jgi:hypothetical protein
LDRVCSFSSTPAASRAASANGSSSEAAGTTTLRYFRSGLVYGKGGQGTARKKSWLLQGKAG